ncbi:carboxymuconolactone decarboxylase family protein [Streptomyces sp. Z26]|uniref:carboxymuconolactone decarboxylase family protein n=1 Tax=Streptomyces TaxID=1883 RepID=UPI000EF16111|nr:carboxymuconolactone decarboxylase family protein [Streptomyces sp. Z26]RLL68713.1 alkyl hydroperoxide reductase [Streptomyces sp. Z26]
MALDDLVAALPDYAGDLGANLRSVIGRSPLPRPRLWGTVLACAVAVRSPPVLRALGPQAREELTPAEYTAAKAAASAMAMTNVFHRGRHLLSDPAYVTLRAGLRTNVLGHPGVDRIDHETWALAVSAVHGCGACLDAHERALRRAGVEREAVQEAFRIAAVIQAAGTTLDAEAVLGD